MSANIFSPLPLPRALALGGVALFGSVGLASTAASAAGGAYYRAELSAPAPKGRFVSRGVVWICEGASCSAPRGTSRPAIMCAALVKEAGTVASFAADGKPLEAAELARCNGEG
ncbi:MAG: hypothetical protein C0520_04205 [Sphingopyxis sp.]|nr:hypothetical protein [Sphingopyxis sp.]